MNWLDGGFIVAVALAVCWVCEGAIDKHAARLKSIELSQERIQEALKLIGSDTRQILNTANRKQETIEEQWLRENCNPPAV